MSNIYHLLDNIWIKIILLTSEIVILVISLSANEYYKVKEFAQKTHGIT